MLHRMAPRLRVMQLLVAAERRELEQQQQQQHVGSRRRRCSETAAACRVPLMQFIDPLDASYASRRAATSKVLA